MDKTLCMQVFVMVLLIPQILKESHNNLSKAISTSQNNIHNLLINQFAPCTASALLMLPSKHQTQILHKLNLLNGVDISILMQVLRVPMHQHTHQVCHPRAIFLIKISFNFNSLQNQDQEMMLQLTILIKIAIRRFSLKVVQLHHLTKALMVKKLLISRKRLLSSFKVVVSISCLKLRSNTIALVSARPHSSMLPNQLLCTQLKSASDHWLTPSPNSQASFPGSL